MRKYVIATIFILLQGSAVGFAGNLAKPREVPAPVSKIYIPYGFDDNDNTEVILHGKFRNTCYRVGRSQYRVDEENKKIQIEATSFVYPEDTFCLQVITPFIQVVKVGMLKAGNYQVTLVENPDVSGAINIAPRITEAPDDYLYAPVSNAKIVIDPETGKQSLNLQGRFPYVLHGCAVMKQVLHYVNPKDILIVQPIMEIVDGERCNNYQYNFDLNYQLKETFSGEGVIHVRVLNGNSLNQFIYLP